MSTPTTASAITQPNAGLSALRRHRCSCACVRCDAQERLFCSASLECGGCCCRRCGAAALHSQRWVHSGMALEPFCKCKVTARLQEDVCDTAGVSGSRWVQAGSLHLNMSRQNPPPSPAPSPGMPCRVSFPGSSQSKTQTGAYSAENRTHNRWNVRRI